VRAKRTLLRSIRRRGGADGGGARVKGCGEDAVLVEHALGVRFFKFCRSAGPESTEIPEVAARFFLESLPVGSRELLVRIHFFSLVRRLFR